MKATVRVAMAAILLCAAIPASAQLSNSFQQGVGGYTNCRSVDISDLNLCNPCSPGSFGYNGTTFADAGNDWLVGRQIPFYGNLSPLLRFENLSLPAGARVVSASLAVVLNDQGGGSRIIGRYLKRPWCADVNDPNGGTTIACVGWRYSADPVHWAVAGALGEGSDLVTNAQFFLPPTGVLTGFVDSVVTTALDPVIVQQWVDSPANNHGVKLQVESLSAPVYYVQPQRTVSASRPVTYHPRLTINYVVPPLLVIRRGASNQVRLSWPTNAVGFVLNRAPATTGTYANPGLTLTNEGTEIVAYDAIQANPRFYRLTLQP